MLRVNSAELWQQSHAREIEHHGAELLDYDWWAGWFSFSLGLLMLGSATVVLPSAYFLYSALLLTVGFGLPIDRCAWNL